MSDYLVIGSGLFGSVFAYEAAKKGHHVTVLEKKVTLAGTSTPRKLKVFRCICTVPIFFTPR